MKAVKNDSDNKKIEKIELLFQQTLSELRRLHEKKLELIKRARAKKNFEELNKIRQSLKKQA